MLMSIIERNEISVHSLTHFLLVCISSYAYRFRAFIPKENPTGTGVIVCPGGSYFWMDKQGGGDEVAKWLCENGIAAFVVEYSLGAGLRSPSVCI